MMTDNVELQGQAIPFVVEDCDSCGDDVWCVTEEARAALGSMEGPLCVVCTSGGQGLGKSELLNRAILGNTSRGFPVGGTRGIWMWSTPVKATASDGAEVNLLLLDAPGIPSGEICTLLEGSGSPGQQNASHHSPLQAIGLLLSSCWVYESYGGLGDSSIADLASLASAICRHIRVGSAGQDEEDIDGMASCFPKLLWVLRDASASQLLDDQGRNLTSRQYLERAVRGDVNNSFSPSKSRSRAIVRGCFEDRECFPLAPAYIQSSTGAESSPSERALSAEYIRQVQAFGTRIMQGADPKTINGVPLNGAMIAQLADNYVASANVESHLSIKDAWDAVCNAECERAISASASLYERLAGSIREESLPLPAYDLTQWHAEASGEALRMFEGETKGREGAVNYRSRLEERLRGLFRGIDAENHRIGCLKAKDAIERLYSEVDARLSGGDYCDFGAYERDRERVKARFLEEVPRNVHSMLVLHEFMEDKVLGAAAKFLSKAAEAADDARVKLESEVETMRFGVLQQQKLLEREIEEHKERRVLQEEYLNTGRQREKELRDTIASEREKHGVELVELGQAHARALRDGLAESEEAERRRIDANFRAHEAECRLATANERLAVLSKRKSPSKVAAKRLEEEARVREVFKKAAASLRVAVASHAQFVERAHTSTVLVAPHLASGGALLAGDWKDAEEDAGLVQWCDVTLDALAALSEGLQRGNDSVLKVVQGLVTACKEARKQQASPSQAPPSASPLGRSPASSVSAATPAPEPQKVDDIEWFSPLPMGNTPGNVMRNHAAAPAGLLRTPGGGLLRRAMGTPARDTLRITPFSQQVASSPWAVHSAAAAQATHDVGSARVGKTALFSPCSTVGNTSWIPGGGIAAAAGLLSPGPLRPFEGLLSPRPFMVPEGDSSQDSLLADMHDVSAMRAASPAASDPRTSPVEAPETAKFPGLGGRLSPVETSSLPPAGAGAHSLSSVDSSRDGPQATSSPLEGGSMSPQQHWSASTVASAGASSVSSAAAASREGSVMGGSRAASPAEAHTQEALFQPQLLDLVRSPVAMVSERIDKLEQTMQAMRERDAASRHASEASPAPPAEDWWCLIESTATKTGEKNGRTYTEYLARIGAQGGVPVRVGKRYSQFLELHRKLVKTFPHVPMPANSAQLFHGLRSSMWFNRFDSDFVECRRVWLEAYMQELLNTPQIAKSVHLQTFLQTNLLLDQPTHAVHYGACPLTPLGTAVVGRTGYAAPPPTQVKAPLPPWHTNSPAVSVRGGCDAPPPTSVKGRAADHWEVTETQAAWQREQLSQTLPLAHQGYADSMPAARTAHTPQPARNAAAALRQARQAKLSYSPLSVVEPTY